MTSLLNDKTVLVVGRDSGIVRGITDAAILALTNTFMTGVRLGWVQQSPSHGFRADRSTGRLADVAGGVCPAQIPAAAD